MWFFMEISFRICFCYLSPAGSDLLANTGNEQGGVLPHGHGVKALGKAMGGCRAVTGEDETGLAGPSAGGENAFQGGTEGGIFKLTGDAQGDGEVEGA